MITHIVLDSKNAADKTFQENAQLFKENWVNERQDVLDFMKMIFNDSSISLEELKYKQRYSIFKYKNGYGDDFEDTLITHVSIFTYARDGYVFSKNENVLELQSLNSFEVTTKHYAYGLGVGYEELPYGLSLPLENDLQDLQRVFSTGKQVLDYPRELYWYGKKE